MYEPAPILEDGPASIPPGPGRRAVAEAAREANRFGLEIIRRAGAHGGNTVGSPLCLTSALSAVTAGACGTTRSQLVGALGLHDDPRQVADRLALACESIATEGGVWLGAAQGLFAGREYVLEQRFLDTVRSRPGGLIEQVDFANGAQAAAQINGWIARRAGGTFPALVDPDALDADTALILADVVHLKAIWLTQFSADATRPRPFYVAGAGWTHVPTMASTLDVAMAERLGLTAVRLPYLGERLHMIVLMPQTPEGFTRLDRTMSVEVLDELTHGMATERVYLTFPKFEIDVPTDDMPALLMAMGARDAFDPVRADFMAIAAPRGDKRLTVSRIKHRAKIRVDEAGTEAAAATMIQLQGMSGAPPAMPREVLLDKPFFYFIRDEITGAVLFSGRLVNPLDTPRP